MRRLGVSGSRCNELEGLGQQFGNESLYSAWKSSDFRNVFKSHSDIWRLSGRLRSLGNFSLSEWHHRQSLCDTARPSCSALQYPLNHFELSYRVVLQAQIVLANGQLPVADPSKYYALEFTGKFARVETTDASQAIEVNRRIVAPA